MRSEPRSGLTAAVLPSIVVHYNQYNKPSVRTWYYTPNILWLLILKTPTSFLSQTVSIFVKMDRRKAGITDIANESDKQFMERTGATAQLKDVLTKIIENRPLDPIEFLADYFETYGDKVSRVARAHHVICMTHYSKPAFETNLRNAYDNLSQNKIGKNLRGINGILYSDLLNYLTKEFPPTVTEKLLKKIQCRDHEVVVFDIFRSGVFTCLVLKDFLHQAEALYQCLDSNQNEKVDKNICDTVIKQLQQSISCTNSGPTSLLEAGHKLGPDVMYDMIVHSPIQTTAIRRYMSLEEFHTSIAEAFLSKVKTLK